MSDFTPYDKAIALVPKFSGFMSYCSSVFIVQHVLRNKKRRNLVYHRLLCGMSFSDTFGAFSHFLSTWPIPKGEAYLAAGTVRTCSAAGFVDQTATLCTPAYNISLAIYYLLTINNGWRESRVSRIEKYLHALPILAGVSTGITSLSLKLYNNAGWICWIAPGTPNHPERHNDSYDTFRMAFMYIPVWVTIIFLALSMTKIYLCVLRQERRMDKYKRLSFASAKRNQSRLVRNQAFLYVGCMCITWLFGTIYRVMQIAGKQPPEAIGILFVFFLPLQGFFNLLVYMSPRYFRKKNSLEDTFSLWINVRSAVRKFVQRTASQAGLNSEEKKDQSNSADVERIGSMNELDSFHDAESSKSQDEFREHGDVEGVDNHDGYKDVDATVHSSHEKELLEMHQKVIGELVEIIGELD